MLGVIHFTGVTRAHVSSGPPRSHSHVFRRFSHTRYVIRLYSITVASTFAERRHQRRLRSRGVRDALVPECKQHVLVKPQENIQAFAARFSRQQFPHSFINVWVFILSMKSKSLPAGDAALQLFTPRSTLSPGPTSKPTPKRFKSLATRIGPKDDPFRQAQAESSPLIAILDDDDDIFGTPRGKKGHSQHRLWDSRDRTEEQRNDDELASLLGNWQAFLTPEKPKREVGYIEPRAIRPDEKATIKDSPVFSTKGRGKHHCQSSALLMPRKTSQEPNSRQHFIPETNSPKKRPRRATAELTLKRLRSVDDDNSNDDSDCLLLPKAKRIKLFSTPIKTNGQAPHVSNIRLGTPASPTNDLPVPATQRRSLSLVPLSKEEVLRTPNPSVSGLATPDASATDSPSPATSRRGIKILSSPQDTDDQGQNAVDTLPSTPASPITAPSSPAITPRSATQERKPSADTVQTKRKRGAQEAGLSLSCGELKRVKFAKPLASMAKPMDRALGHRIETPRSKLTAGKSNPKGTCTLARLFENCIVN